MQAALTRYQEAWIAIARFLAVCAARDDTHGGGAAGRLAGAVLQLKNGSQTAQERRAVFALFTYLIPGRRSIFYDSFGLQFSFRQ